MKRQFPVHVYLIFGFLCIVIITIGAFINEALGFGVFTDKALDIATAGGWSRWCGFLQSDSSPRTR